MGRSSILRALPLSLVLACGGRPSPSPTAPAASASAAAAEGTSAAAPETRPGHVTIVDLAGDSEEPEGAPGPRRFVDLGYDAFGALLARVTPPRAGRCEAARLDARGATIVTLACPEARYDAWPSPDGSWVARTEYMARGALAPPERRLVVVAEDGERVFVAHGGGYPAGRAGVVWSATGRHLLVHGATLLFFDVDTRRAWGRATGSWPLATAIESDGSHAAVGSKEGDVVVIAREGRAEPVRVGHVEGTIAAVALEGAHVAAATREGHVVLWDTGTGEGARDVDLGGPVQSLAWSADARVLGALSRGALWLVRPGGEAPVVVRPVALRESTTLVASDREGRVEAPAGALSLVRWRDEQAPGEWVLRDAAAEQKRRGASVVREGLVADLFVSGP